MREPDEPRLLPWTGTGSKPCYLITDDNGGPVSRVADTTEAVQLGMGRDLLAHARELLPGAPRGELRHLAECLTDALADALRVAESRGRRLGRLN
ncbi:hypothetical protein [Streptomyces capillispiralis]|uniref:Uncharacterized protein n=1 Tax=Streptomyces capillispiralis TaxID=68182 RepID=A0A561TI75_9ACTN|nr:hypothetical protein [Streptomyces capillispiralis]TWF86825.1 hypothetical protein FHX78_113816 [Streptomyces capillispiralis]GHH90766.1 hypothetical protein GCM10017779_12230 [Streptomyces capillispiralis]